MRSLIAVACLFGLYILYRLMGVIMRFLRWLYKKACVHLKKKVALTNVDGRCYEPYSARIAGDPRTNVARAHLGSCVRQRAQSHI